MSFKDPLFAHARNVACVRIALNTPMASVSHSENFTLHAPLADDCSTLSSEGIALKTISYSLGFTEMLIMKFCIHYINSIN